MRYFSSLASTLLETAKLFGLLAGMGSCPVCQESFDLSTTRAHLLTFHTGRGGEDEWGCGDCSFLGTFDEVAAHCLRLRHDCGVMSLRETVPAHFLVSLLREIQDKMGLGKSEEPAQASQPARNELDQSASSQEVNGLDARNELDQSESSQEVKGFDSRSELDLSVSSNEVEDIVDWKPAPNQSWSESPKGDPEDRSAEHDTEETEKLKLLDEGGSTVLLPVDSPIPQGQDQVDSAAALRGHQDLPTKGDQSNLATRQIAGEKNAEDKWSFGPATHRPRDGQLKHLSRGRSREKQGCSVCGMVLTRQSSLKRHMLLHTEEGLKKLFCASCSKTFRTLPALTKHEKKWHTGPGRGGVMTLLGSLP